MGRLDRDGVKQPYSVFSVFNDTASNLGFIGDEPVIVGPLQSTLVDFHAVIRNALIGGGEGRVNGDDIKVTEILAKELIEAYCYPARPAILDIALAVQILKAAIRGVAPVAAGSKKKGTHAGRKPS